MLVGIIYHTLIASAGRLERSSFYKFIFADFTFWKLHFRTELQNLSQSLVNYFYLAFVSVALYTAYNYYSSADTVALVAELVVAVERLLCLLEQNSHSETIA